MKGRTGKHPHHRPGKKHHGAVRKKPDSAVMPSSADEVEGEASAPRLDTMSRGGKPKKWMKGAVKHPGAMTRAAKREGVSNSQYEQEHKHDSGHSGQMARLALTFKKERPH